MADEKLEKEREIKDKTPAAPEGLAASEGDQKGAAPVLTPEKKKELGAGTAGPDTKRGMLRNVMKLTWQYLTSEKKWTAMRDIALVVGIAVGLNYINVLFNKWNGDLGNALEAKDWDGFLLQLVIGTAILGGRSLTGMFNIYRLGMLKSHWQEWITKKTVNDLLDNQAYQRLQTVDRNVPNMEQIPKDADLFTTTTTDLAMGAFAAIMSGVTFMTILYNQAGDVELAKFGLPDIVIPKMMFWFAPVYAVAGAWLSGKISKPLVNFLDMQTTLESGLRNGVLRLIQFADAIALYKSEEAEREILMARVDALIQNDRAVLFRQQFISLFQSAYSNAAIVLPYLLASPMYFFGGAGLGTLMSTINAFNQAQSAMAYPITSAGPRAGLYALGVRLMRFFNGAAKLEEDIALEAKTGTEVPEGLLQEDQKKVLVLRDGDTNNVVIDRLTLLQKEGEKPLIDEGSLNITPKERIMVTGPEAAKSALVHALGGLDTPGKGQIILPGGRDILVEPKNAPLPAKSLKGILSYPKEAESFTRGRMEFALHSVGLKALIPYLDDDQTTGEMLDKKLTAEEKQRLVFARILVQKPNILVLEDAASGLDDQTAKTLYKILIDRMTTTIMIDLTQKEALASLFTRHAKINPEGRLSIEDVLQNDRGLQSFDYGVSPTHGRTPYPSYPYGVPEQNSDLPGYSVW